MINRRFLLVLPGALSVSACMPHALEIEVSGAADAIEIAAYKYVGPLELFRTGAAIASITIWQKETAPQNPLWQVQSRDRCQTAIHRVQYGILPNAFELISAMQPLSEGIDYSVSVEECGPSNGGGADFRIVGGRVQQVWTVTLERAK
jgi:hypothetical protein